MFGKDDTKDEPAAADDVQPAFGQTITMPAPTDDTSATDTTDAGTSPVVPVDDNPVEVPETPSDTPATPTANDDLIKIKQEALQNLAPLVGQLNQTPEEKFKTTMMMIQAADDQTLIKDAYESANQITDEKTRAQALLDIVNEINYFT